MNENEFVDIKGYENMYKINRKGEIKSLKYNKERILTPIKNNYGYFYIKLCRDNVIKNHHIHSLLTKTFISEYDTKIFVTEIIDDNRSNNNIENLRIVHKRDIIDKNTKYGTCVYKLDNKFVLNINVCRKKLYFGIFDTQEKAENKYFEIKNKLEEIEKVTHNYTFKRTKIGKEYFVEFFPIL